MASSTQGTDGMGGDSSSEIVGDAGLKFDIVAAVFQQMFPNTFFCTIPVRRDEKVRSEPAGGSKATTDMH